MQLQSQYCLGIPVYRNIQINHIFKIGKNNIYTACKNGMVFTSSYMGLT